MADASDSKSDGGDLVWVQVPSPASRKKRGSSAELPFFLLLPNKSTFDSIEVSV